MSCFNNGWMFHFQNKTCLQRQRAVRRDAHVLKEIVRHVAATKEKWFHEKKVWQLKQAKPRLVQPSHQCVCHLIYFWMLLHLFLSRSALGCSSLIHPTKSLLLFFSLPLFFPPQALAASSSSLEHLYGLKNHRLEVQNGCEFCWIYCRSRWKWSLAHLWFWQQPRLKTTFSCLAVETFVALQHTDRYKSINQCSGENIQVHRIQSVAGPTVQNRQGRPAGGETCGPA